MDFKKMYPYSLVEDDLNLVSPSSTPAPRPLSRLGGGGRGTGSGSGSGSSPATSSSHHHFVDPDRDQPLSCVTRETAHQDCARHRFIVWAAVKRNSCSRMTVEDRLKCPLIKCAQQFQDHESMLKHLACCRHLPSGEYLCYNHMKVERFDDVKCKRCLGHPSKRRKMMSLAKNFFHSLGHKSKKGHAHAFGGLDIDSVSLIAPPSYDSLGIAPINVNGDNPSELSSTEILEIDSVEVTNACTTAAVTAPGGVIDPQALLFPILPELDSTGLSNDFMQWQPTSLAHAPLYQTDIAEDSASPHPGPKPALQLNTYGLHGRRHAPRPAPRPEPPRSKGLSPSSSVRSTASTDTTASTASNATATSNVSSLISPASNWSGVWSMASGINTNLTTPIEGILADDAFAEAMGSFDEPCPSYLHDFYSELPAELPADFTSTKVSDNLAADSLLCLDVPPSANVSYAANIVMTEESTDLIDLDEPKVDQVSVCCSEVKSMIGSAWDALQEHIVSSMVKIQHVADNPLASQLRSMSTKTIAKAGLQTLRALLNGGQPSSATDMLCFVHLIYAFSLVVHEKGASHRAKELFLQSLSYTNSLPPNDRDSYTRLAYAIWQPPGITQADITRYFALSPSSSNSLGRSSSSSKGKSPQSASCEFGLRGNDSLLLAARNFLDDLESSLVLGPIPDSVELQTCKLFSRHLQDNPSASVHQAFAITATYVLSELINVYFDTVGLQDEVNKVIQRVKNGEISSVRRVEIELLHAGKECIPARRFFNDFVPQVRDMCDPIYEQHDAGTSRRNDYHGLGITLLETVFPEFDSSPAGSDHLLDDDELDDSSFEQYFDKLNSGGDGLDATTMSFVGMGDSDFDHYLGGGASHNLSEITTTAGLQVPIVTMTPPESTKASSQISSPATTDDQKTMTVQSSDTATTTDQSAGSGGGGGDGQHKIGAVGSQCCEICGYRPKGDPQWFKGSMAKHKKMQHSTAPPRIYKCPYPGCSSQYKNRPDNLRQHQIEKNHWAPGEEGETHRRPSKRKKIQVEQEEE